MNLMVDYFQCARIETSFSGDNLNIPKKGECKLLIENNFGKLFIKFKKDKIYFDENNTTEIASIRDVSI